MKRTFLVFFTLITTTLVLSGIALGQRDTATGVEIDKNIEMMRKNLRGSGTCLSAVANAMGDPPHHPLNIPHVQLDTTW